MFYIIVSWNLPFHTLVITFTKSFLIFAPNIYQILVAHIHTNDLGISFQLRLRRSMWRRTNMRPLLRRNIISKFWSFQAIATKFWNQFLLIFLSSYCLGSQFTIIWSLIVYLSQIYIGTTTHVAQFIAFRDPWLKYILHVRNNTVGFSDFFSSYISDTTFLG